MVEDRNNECVVLVSILRISVWRPLCPSGNTQSPVLLLWATVCMLQELRYFSTSLVPCGTAIGGAIAGADILLCVYVCRQERVPSGEDPTCQQSAFSHRQGLSNASVCY